MVLAEIQLEYYSVSDFDPPKTGSIFCTERLEFSLVRGLYLFLDR